MKSNSSLKFQIEEKHRPLIEKWQAELRTENWKQGRKRLYRKLDNSYCCLGVLACLSGVNQNNLIDRPYILRDWDLPIPNTLTGFTGKLSQILSSLNDYSLSEKDTQKLGNLAHNMEKKGIPVKEYSFEEIADFLDQVIEYVPEDSTPELV